MSERTIEDDLNRMVTVCDACLTAVCWHGEIMCDKAETAGTVDKPVRELLALGYEHPSYFARERIARICGGAT